MYFSTTRDLRSEDCARQFFALLQRHDGPFVPGFWGGSGLPPKKIDFAALEKPIEQWQDKSGLFLYSSRSVDRGLHWFIRTTGWMERIPFIAMFLKEAHVRKYSCDAEQIAGLARDVYLFSGAVHGYIMRKLLPITSSFYPYIDHSIPNVHWLDFFGPPYVEMLGEEKLRTAPCHKIEELQDGGFMLMLTPTPVEAYSREGRMKAEAVKRHLGEEYFYHPEDGGDEYATYKRRTVPVLDLSETPIFRPEPMQLEEMHQGIVTDGDVFIESVPAMIQTLKERLGPKGDRLDLSISSLKILDKHMLQNHEEPGTSEFLTSTQVIRELCAYSGEIVRQFTGGEWKIEEIEDAGPVPVVRYGPKKLDYFDPLPMVLRVLDDGLSDGEGFLLQAELQVWQSDHRRWRRSH
jgi:hypothetical protein